MKTFNTIAENILEFDFISMFGLYFLLFKFINNKHERQVRFFHVFKYTQLFTVWVVIMLIGLDKLGVFELKIHTIYLALLCSIPLTIPFLHIKMSNKLSEFFKKLITHKYFNGLIALSIFFIILSIYFLKIDFIEKYHFLIFYTIIPLNFLADVFAPQDEDEDEEVEEEDEDDDKPILEILFPWIKTRSNPKQ